MEVIHLPGTHTPQSPYFLTIYWYSKCFSESILWGHVWELVFNLFLVICSICLTICSSFLPKMTKTKNRKTWVCLFFFFGGGALSQVRTFAKKNLKNQTLSKKNKKSSNTKKAFFGPGTTTFAKRFCTNLSLHLPIKKNKLRFSCSRSSSILRGALLKKSRNKQGSRKKN